MLTSWLLAAVLSQAPVKAPLPAVTPTANKVEAMKKLEPLRGVWAGKATGSLPDGTAYEVTQVERVGPLLGGDVLMIEGRGYRPDGTTGFNALAVISYEAHSKKYEIRAYAQGLAGTFPFKPTADGYVWETPAGPNSVVRFTATFKDGTWREISEFVSKGKPPVKTFEMNLKRVSDTDWPLVTPAGPDLLK